MNKLPFVLVPGAYHGAWCFEKLIACLAELGHAAKGVDLPLCPDKTTPVSMQDCMDAMERAIPAGERVVLCGHSNGGHFISAFAQLHPERVAGLVYITATLLPSGCSAFDHPKVENPCPKPFRLKNEVCKWYPVESEQDFQTIWDYFYTGADRADVERAVGLLQPQPLGSVGTPNHLTDDRYGTLPRWYVLCTADRCIHPDEQQAMADAVPCRKVFRLAAGHSPFLTHPKELAQILCEVKEELGQ